LYKLLRIDIYLQCSNGTRKDKLIEKHQQCLSGREKRPFFTNRNNVD